MEANATEDCHLEEDLGGSAEEDQGDKPLNNK